jgi:hypothetical protein
VFTTDRLLSPSWARWIQTTTPHPISVRHVLILSTHQTLVCILFPPLRTTRPAYLSLFHFITWKITGKMRNHYIIFFSLLLFLSGPNIFLSALFSNTLDLCSSFNETRSYTYLVKWGIIILFFQSPVIPLRSKYFPQHPVLEHPRPTFFPQCHSFLKILLIPQFSKYRTATLKFYAAAGWHKASFTLRIHKC